MNFKQFQSDVQIQRTFSDLLNPVVVLHVGGKYMFCLEYSHNDKKRRLVQYRVIKQ